MKTNRILLMTTICLSGLLCHLTAQTYNPEEVAKLKTFLSQASAIEGKKNYEQLGLDSLKQVDWKSVPGLK